MSASHRAVNISPNRILRVKIHNQSKWHNCPSCRNRSEIFGYATVFRAGYLFRYYIQCICADYHCVKGYKQYVYVCIVFSIEVKIVWLLVFDDYMLASHSFYWLENKNSRKCRTCLVLQFHTRKLPCSSSLTDYVQSFRQKWVKKEFYLKEMPGISSNHKPLAYQQICFASVTVISAYKRYSSNTQNNYSTYGNFSYQMVFGKYLLSSFMIVP